jgi:hypothetical protein
MTKSGVPTDNNRQRAPLVFLDFDDVICLNAPYGAYDLLAPNPPDDLWTRLFHEPAVRTLEVIVTEFDPQVVITTSWLRFMERAAIEHVLMKCAMSFVAERLHAAWEAPGVLGKSRLQVIEAWLQKNHLGEPFVVLDDALSGTGLSGSRWHRQGRVVLCKVDEGLHERHLAQVRRALSTRAPKRR